MFRVFVITYCIVKLKSGVLNVWQGRKVVANCQRVIIINQSMYMIEQVTY